jgi:pyruvate/2-oxoglutarate dehydrogenase complex dihydrolipoamide dehydrogenase (E3) component
MDEHNRKLVDQVHPSGWVNPEPQDRYHLVVIGAGTAGLVTAAGAAGLGAKVALIEKHLMGGDCLNVGCVPSKTLIRSSRALAEAAAAARLGIRISGAQADFPAVMERVRRIRAGISPHDSARRFKELGVDVFLGEARFLDADHVEVGGKKLRFKKAVIASGARAAVPPIEGLAGSGYLTNETVFNLTELPARLAVIGGGPIGCELAQVFRRLGSEVTVFHTQEHLLEKEDEDAARVVQERFLSEGVKIVLNTRISKVSLDGGAKVIHYESSGQNGAFSADAVLVAAGRAPNVGGLNLESVGVDYDPRSGVKVDDHLRTSNPRIFAAGDVCMPLKFTHAADFAARTVIQNALFFGSKKLSALTVPWCTYTDPEIARVGLSESEAKERGVAVNLYLKPFKQVDRAVTDGEEEGFVKILTAKGSDRIVGATVVSRHAGDLIGELTLAMTAGIGLGKIASVIHPYPTQAEAIRQLGDAYNRTRLTPLVKKLFRLYLDWTR